MSNKFRSFRAEGIVGHETYELKITSDATIIIGPNGTGKSTFLNVFYLFLTRQWTRLTEYQFSNLTLEVEGDSISLSATDLLSADSILKLSPRMRAYINKLSQSQLLGAFMTAPLTSSLKTERIWAETLEVPISEVRPLRNYLVHQTKDLFEASFIEVERKLTELNLEKVLYLPTYRRIEKDLKSILPDIEDRVRTRSSDYPSLTRQGHSFAEIVSFGMEDIGKIISDFTAKLNAVAKNKSNAAAQEYIRDMVQGRIKEFSIGPIRDIEASAITEFVARLDNQLLSQEDKLKLTNEIEKLRRRQAGKPPKDMQYLGFFVEKMLRVYLDLLREEAPLIQFVRVVQKYFVNKTIRYENYNFEIVDLQGNQININDLSSGEKQILSIFAYLLLTSESSYLVFIDEPELSLSVPWQKTFLPDILDTARCKYLLAVSHSPFVFDNELRNHIVDVRKLRITETYTND